MNYANDPLWAYKHSMEPQQRQAYENQVMTARADREHHRAEFDAAAIATSAVLIGNWFQGRAARKAAKARQAYASAHCPQDYDQRRFEYETAVQQVQVETATTIGKLEADIAKLESRVPVAGTAKSYRTMRARLEALTAMVENKRLALATTLETLSMKYRDILEYEQGLSKLQ